jgi:predicted nucleic acid-binding protein
MTEQQQQIIRQSSLNRAVDLAIADKIQMDKIISFSQRFEKYVINGK